MSAYFSRGISFDTPTKAVVPRSDDQLPPAKPKPIPGNPPASKELSAEEKKGKVVADYFGIPSQGITRFDNENPNDGTAELFIGLVDECVSHYYLRSDGNLVVKSDCGGNNSARLFSTDEAFLAKVRTVLMATGETLVTRPKNDTTPQKEVDALKAKLTPAK